VAVSGTVSQTVFNTRKVVDHAFRRCRMPPQGVSAEQLQVAQENLYLILSDLANRGLQLWCIDKLILPMYTNTAQIPVPVGTVDLLTPIFAPSSTSLVPQQQPLQPQLYCFLLQVQ